MRHPEPSGCCSYLSNRAAGREGDPLLLKGYQFMCLVDSVIAIEVLAREFSKET
jgi:hypothetical protein